MLLTIDVGNTHTVLGLFDEGVIYLVSPLDSANATEVELSDEQEALVAWLHKQGVQHVRVEE